MSADALDKTEKISKPGERYTSEELMVRLKFFIGMCLAVTLIGIVFVVLYSIIFVTQPLNAMSPIDAKFFELIIPVATFLCGTLSGIMLAGSGKEAALAGAAAQQMVNSSFGPKPPMGPQPGGFRPQPMQTPMQSYAPPPSYGAPTPSPFSSSPVGMGMSYQSPTEDMGLMPGQSPKMTDDDFSPTVRRPL